MDTTMSVNEMLRDEITKVTCTLIPPGFHGDVRSVRMMQDSLSRLIDALGEQSAAAQGLNKIITTADKLRNSPTHILYLLKDSAAKGGKGEAIGLLKVGRKHLFLFDEKARVCEVEPLCVLDFFVLLDRQRHGHGRALFDHMLQDQQTTAGKLAVDGPSAKMERFLHKNYGLERLLRQNNNFAVCSSFFGNAPEISKTGRSAASTPGGGAGAGADAVGRFAALKPQSAIATVIHGVGSYYEEANNGRPESPQAPAAEHAPSPAPSPEPEPVPETEVKPNPERPSTLHVATAAPRAPASPSPAPPSHAASPAGSTSSRRDSQLTDKGYFDVKFYHNKLW